MYQILMPGYYLVGIVNIKRRIQELDQELMLCQPNTKFLRRGLFDMGGEILRGHGGCGLEGIEGFIDDGIFLALPLGNKLFFDLPERLGVINLR